MLRCGSRPTFLAELVSLPGTADIWLWRESARGWCNSLPMSPSWCVASICPQAEKLLSNRDRPGCRCKKQHGCILLPSDWDFKIHPGPSWADGCLLQSRARQPVTGDWHFAERCGSGNLANFNANAAVWYGKETEWGCFFCFTGKSCTRLIRLHPHSYWHGVLGVAVLFHLASDPEDVPWLLQQTNLCCRLPRALTTTLWGFGAYDIILRKRNQHSTKSTWWAGSLRRNQKSNLEQVRPLSWGVSLCNTAPEFWLFSVPTKAFGFSY